jgi:hypothetical protein
MATAEEIRDAVRRAVDHAINEEPSDRSTRARIFVAGLQGWLDNLDPDIAAELERLRYPNGRP